MKVKTIEALAKSLRLAEINKHRTGEGITPLNRISTLYWNMNKDAMLAEAWNAARSQSLPIQVVVTGGVTINAGIPVVVRYADHGSWRLVSIGKTSYQRVAIFLTEGVDFQVTH